MGRRPRFTTPLTRVRDTLVKYVVRPLDVFSPGVRLLIGFALLIVITALLLFTNYSSGLYADYKDGEVVKATVVSPADITTVDISETERRRDAARETTRPVFFLDSTRGESSAQSFQAAWEELRTESEDRNPKTQPTWNGEGGAAVARAIIAHRFDPAGARSFDGANSRNRRRLCLRRQRCASPEARDCAGRCSQSDRPDDHAGAADAHDAAQLRQTKPGTANPKSEGLVARGKDRALFRHCPTD